MFVLLRRVVEHGRSTSLVLALRAREAAALGVGSHACAIYHESIECLSIYLAFVIWG
jgi:hypothetical protein